MARMVNRVALSAGRKFVPRSPSPATGRFALPSSRPLHEAQIIIAQTTMKTSSDESFPARPGGASADVPPDDPAATAPGRPHASGEGSAAGDDTSDASAEGRSDGTDASRPREIGGQAGPEPTRYGDWEKKGRCTDF